MNVIRNLRASAVAAVLAGFLGLAASFLPAQSAGPIETSIFAVQGVDVDVTSTDAATAKNQALMDVQVKAFFELVERLGTPELAAELREKLKPEDIAPYLRSLSIEKETSGPGRYIGTFTVRFLPKKMQKLFADYGIRLPAEQADPVLVIPVYRSPDGPQLWEDNPWRQAWIDLKGEQGIVPIIIPLGDLEDTGTLTVEEAINGDAVKLDAIRKRYGAPSILVAQAQPTNGTDLHVFIEGETKLGKVTINKVYGPGEGSTGAVEADAVQAFQKVLYKAYQQQAAKAAEEQAARAANTSQSLAVTVPFNSPREWNAIRSRVLNTPKVSTVDLTTLNVDGALIRLVFTGTLEELQGNMQRVGLNLVQGPGGWIIQPM